MDTDAAQQITTLRSRLFSVVLGAALLLASQLYGAETAEKQSLTLDGAKIVIAAAVSEARVKNAPGAAIAADQHYRETDLAIDYCEDVARLPTESVERIVTMMRSRGLTAKVSSIHVNGWFGAYDKLATARRMMLECFGEDLDLERARYLFIGDSPNDAPMFAFFPHAVGVANVRDFDSRIECAPAYVTRARCGAGFRELVDFLLGPQ